MSFSQEKCFVYVVEAENGLIKIGASAKPIERARGICANSPIKCRLIISIAGIREDEQKIHAQFLEHRAWSEWFRKEGAVRQFVDEHRGQGVERIVEWAELDFASSKDRHRAALRKAWARPGKRAEQSAALKEAFEHRRAREHRAQGAA